MNGKANKITNGRYDKSKQILAHTDDHDNIKYSSSCRGEGSKNNNDITGLFECTSRS